MMPCVLSVVSVRWSLYEVENLYDEHPYGDGIEIAYTDHWGDKTVGTEVNGCTWLDLYIAADKLIRESGDEHHVFIEAFRRSSIVPSVFFMTTGS